MKKNWAKYNGEDGIIEIIIRDESGSKQDVLKFNQRDHKTQAKIAEMLLDKWDVKLTPCDSFEKKKNDFFEF